LFDLNTFYRLTEKEARARRRWTPWTAVELSEARRLLLNQLAKPEESVEIETEEMVTVEMVTVIAVIGGREAEDRHQATSASSAEELAIGKNQYNN
jgi:hypothetical protein